MKGLHRILKKPYLYQMQRRLTNAKGLVYEAKAKELFFDM
jgi:hypothetical protein